LLLALGKENHEHALHRRHRDRHRTRLGHGAVYLSQTLKFRAPVRPGDKVDVLCVVKDVIREKRRIVLDCSCRVGDTVVLDGEASVLAPSKES